MISLNFRYHDRHHLMLYQFTLIVFVIITDYRLTFRYNDLQLHAHNPKYYNFM